MVRRGSVHIICLLIVFKGISQQSITAYLQSALSDTLYTQWIDVANLRANHSQTIKWIDRLELRTQTNEFDLGQQEYGFRIYGSRISDINFYKKQERLQSDYYHQLAQLQLKKNIITRYKAIVDFLFNQKESDLLQEQELLIEKKNKYLESLFAHQLETEIKDLVQSFRKKENASLKQNELKDKKQILVKSNGLITIEKDSIITIQELKSILQNPPAAVDYLSVSSIKAKLELEKLILEEEKLKSSKWDVLDFVTARWRNRTNDLEFNEKFGLGAGFRLPYSGSYKRNKNQIKLESSLLKIQLDQQNYDNRQQIDQLKSELMALVLNYERQEQKLNDFIAKFDMSRLAISPNVKPLDLLLIEETILDWKEDIVLTEKNIYKKYIDYIDEAYAIQSMPLRNFIFKGIPLILK